MKKFIAFLFRWFKGDLAEDVIRHLIDKYVPGHHLHRNPPKKEQAD